MPPFLLRFQHVLTLPWKLHFFGSFVIVLVIAVVMSLQIGNRRSFANSELRDDVIDRWGAPIDQPAPSVRYVASGSVFSNLESLPLDSQDVTIEARMNYRKRGLIYFSGFDFTFHGSYGVENVVGHDIDVVFVFPTDLQKNKILLSDLQFSVDGVAAPVKMSGDGNRLVWTGRVPVGAKRSFVIDYRGRGLESFTYRLDPALPARNLAFTVGIEGGDTWDYAQGVVPAASASRSLGRTTLTWKYPSLQSGVPLGVILPSEESWDSVIGTMVRRSWATFLLFFGGLSVLTVGYKRPLRAYETYLISAAYGLFFVLLAYFAAFANFYVAYLSAVAIVGGMLYVYARNTLASDAGLQMVGLIGSFLVVPTTAVILEGYTGLIYTLEIAAGLCALMFLTTRPVFRGIFDRFFGRAPDEPGSGSTSALADPEGQALT